MTDYDKLSTTAEAARNEGMTFENSIPTAASSSRTSAGWSANFPAKRRSIT